MLQTRSILGIRADLGNASAPASTPTPDAFTTSWTTVDSADVASSTDSFQTPTGMVDVRQVVSRKNPGFGTGGE